MVNSYSVIYISVYMSFFDEEFRTRTFPMMDLWRQDTDQPSLPGSTRCHLSISRGSRRPPRAR